MLLDNLRRAEFKPHMFGCSPHAVQNDQIIVRVSTLALISMTNNTNMHYWPTQARGLFLIFIIIFCYIVLL